jgi:excisionase family DNA binding protein
LAKRIKGPSDAAVRDTVTPFAVDPHKMADLGRQAKQLLQSLKDEGLLAVETIRVHRKGQPDRRFQLEYSVDPQEPEAVIFRMRPASKADLGAEPAEMLTTQEVANRLNVSRPYVSKLVDQGVFKGIQLTQAGHRRIPAVEVLRVAADMRVSRRAALDEMEGLTADLRSKELEAARGAPKRGWVKQA